MSIPASQAATWLNGVPLAASSTLFFIGANERALRAELAKRAWTGRVIALAPSRFSGLDQIAASLEPDAEHPVVVLEPEVVRNHREAVKDTARQIGRAWFGARANQEARRRNGPPYLLNTLRNVRAIANEGDAAALAGAFANVPALVVGAGPSLDRNIEHIAAYRNRAVIIAADTALRPLLGAGIEPHFVVAADPSETNARHLCDLLPMAHAALVAEGSVDPESLRAFEGRTFFFRLADHHPWPWLRAAGLDRGKLRSWGSVLTSGYDLALTMGCRTIVFAGADLAFTDSRPYARGTTFEETWYREAMWGVPIESSWSGALASWPETNERGVDGANVRTAPHLRSFRDWIATDAAKQSGVTIVNGTGGGILAGEGIVQVPLDRALAQLHPLNVDVRAITAALHRRSPVQRSLDRKPDAATLRAWTQFTGGALESSACLQALGHAVVAPRLAATPEPVVKPVVSEGVELNLEGGDLLAQIESAWQTLGSHHRLMLIDRTNDRSGTSVRRALYAFLEERPGLSARYGRFFDPADVRSWIDRRPVAELNPGEDRTKWLDSHAAVANRLTPLIVEQLQPASVLDIGCGAGHWMRAFEANGVADIDGVEEGLRGYVPTRRFDISLCLGLAHRVPMAVATSAIDAATSASDTVVFSVPAAGVGSTGFVNERPWPVWHRLFLACGFAPHDELRPLIEERFGGFATPFDLLVVYRRIAPRGSDLPAETTRAILESAARIDDLVLQRHWHMRAQESQIAAAQAHSAPLRSMLSYDELVIDPVRMSASAVEGERIFRYRTAAGTLATMTEGIDSPRVTEDGVVVPSATQHGAISFQSSDRSDPRVNGKQYAVRLPAFVAWLETCAITTITERRL